MKKIVVTGSSGFIGFYLSKKLLETGFKVIGIDNHSDYYNVALKKYRLSILEKFCNFEFLNKDINNLEKLSEECDLAINLAAQAGVRVDPEKEYLYREANVKGFEAFCNFFINKRIKRIIYASSSSVYSDAGFEKFNESKTELKPRSAYGMSKLLNEKYAEEIVNRENISMIGLRFFSVYGPMGRPDMAYYLFTNAIKNDEAINLNNNGQMARDMTYIDDIVNGIYGAVKLIFQESYKSKHEIFNLGNDRPIETSYLLSTIEKELGKRAKIKPFETKNESFRTHADITKAKNLLGYSPQTNFNQGIKKFINWHNEYKKH